ncbi:MAG TPA: hypothetical protein VNN18_08955 [Candidatus Xenobia bacterium]|nr:hypothetical protein [Candidatus Xenobia bacterium]
MRCQNRKERGVALILALVALLIIAALAAALIYMATSETSLVTSQKAAARSFYSAMGGIEEARYRMIPGLTAAQGGVNNFDPINPGNNTQPFARVPALPPPGVPPADILYIVNVANGAAPANVNAVGFEPSAAEDPRRTIEVPGAVNIRAVASNQVGSGTASALDWQWVRINLKTELAAQQDLNFDGLLDQDPIFLFQGRQYRGTDLLGYDPDGPGPSPAGGALPPPWGPNPLLVVPPITDRPCVAPICATPVYVLTGRGNVNVGGGANANRLVRAEVSVATFFSLDGGIFSQPGIDLQGNMQASGRDICDPDCATMLDDPLTSANENGLTNIFPPNLPSIGWGTNFDSYSQGSVPPNCRSVIPAQSEAPQGSQLLSTAGRTDPHCDPALNPNCVCQPPQCGKKGCQYFTCVMANAPQLFDLDTLFAALAPLARQLGTPVDSYYPQPNGTNLTCDASGCQGQNVELGGFPFADPVAQTGADFINGINADPIITYVPGDFKCTNKCTGAGILMVDGDFELNSSMSFYGIILVRGSVTVLGGGSAPTPCNIYGSLITRGGVSTDLGGSICFQYNSCAQRGAAYYSPLTGLAFREMPQ